MMTAQMKVTGDTQRVVYTVEHRGNCILITGEVPASAFQALTHLAPKKSVLDADVARMYGANFAFGLPDDLSALRRAGAPAAERRVRDANPGLSESAVKWLASGERGVSSETIFGHLTGIDALKGFRMDVPYDPSDFRRCQLLLEQVPELMTQFYRMAEVNEKWANLYSAWPAIIAAMDEEAPGWREGGTGKRAEKAYQLIKHAIGR